MNIETLKYFQYIAKYKNITQAAKHLYISQSTLSRHIMSLENELGVKLFERNNKMITLTDAGKTLYQESDSFVNHMDSLLKNVTSAGKGQSGILKITAPKNLYNHIHRLLLATQSEYSDINFFVESYEFSEIPLAIKYNLYNIGLTYDYALFDHENLDCIHIGKDEFSLVFSAKYLEGDTKTVLTNVVKSMPFILPSYANPPFLQQIQAELEKITGHKVHKNADVNTSDSLILNASLGLGYGLIPNSWTRLLSDENRLAIMSPPDIRTETDIVAVCRKSSASELTVTVFDILKKLSAEHCTK